MATKTIKANIQKSTEIWYDESGNPIQVNRLSKTEKLMERTSGSLLREAVRLHNDLAKFKAQIHKVCEEVYELYYRERGLEPKGKGNFTFYNLDRTIKVEVNINETIEFDELGISAAKQLLDEFLSDNITTKDDVIKHLVLDAFTTTRGKFDRKKIMNLLRYRAKVKDDKFVKALDLLQQSIRKPNSRVYFRIWQREKGGQWENIDLNFSSVEMA